MLAGGIMNNKDAHYLKNKTVLVYGATGGIGRAVVSVFHGCGARVIAGGRNCGELEAVGREQGTDQSLFCADFTDLDNLIKNRDRLMKTIGRLDILVITAGHDIRKLFHQQTADEIGRTIRTNLVGTALLLNTFLPVFRQQGAGTVATVGGFGDGRLAFPCHALDASCRAGVRTLFEGVQRENPETSLRFLYFCPPAVSTKTETPYISLWEELGVGIVTPETAAEQLAGALRRGKSWYMTGSAFERFGVRLNAVFPGLANRLFMNAMGKTMLRYSSGGRPDHDHTIAKLPESKSHLFFHFPVSLWMQRLHGCPVEAIHF